MAKKIVFDFKEDLVVKTAYGNFTIPCDFLKNIRVSTAVEGYEYLEIFMDENWINLVVSEKEANKVVKFIHSAIVEVDYYGN